MSTCYLFKEVSKKTRLVFGLGCFLFTFMPCVYGDGSPRLIQTDSGLVIGIAGSDPSVTVFKGLPFAAPPVGDLRWQEPQPPIAWQGVRKADTFGKSCMQNITRRFLPWTEEYQIGNDVDEDCLTLNIWTSNINKSGKSAQALIPVLVYIHGGAYTGGSGEVLLYNGEQLAKKGIVVVTVNYRVGIFGFFSHPELSSSSPQNTSGNYGLLDNIAALRWVQKNIGAFGGDPNQVTIAGQSAGAASIHYLTASPLAKGLFHRAIAQSGPWSESRNTTTLEGGEQKALSYMRAWGIDSLKVLRMMSAEDLQKLNVDFANRFLPIVDGWVLPASVTQQHQNKKQNDVPMLTGLTADEGSSNANYREMTEVEKQVQRDQGLLTMKTWSNFRAQYGHSPTYLYYMKRKTPWPEYPDYGAFHSSEIPYVFHNLHLIDRPWEALDYTLADAMSDYWVNFIKTGNPNGKGLLEWPATGEAIMQFDLKSFVQK